MTLSMTELSINQSIINQSALRETACCQDFHADPETLLQARVLPVT